MAFFLSCLASFTACVPSISSPTCLKCVCLLKKPASFTCLSIPAQDKLTKPAGLVAPQPWYKKLVPGGASKEESPEAAGSAVQLQQRQMQPGLDLQVCVAHAWDAGIKEEMLGQSTHV